MNTIRVVSGIRPTGSVHLGNYLGAIAKSVALQDLYQSFYFIADLHAITDMHDSKSLNQHTLSTAALYLACGIDPEKATLFVQSHVPAHAQLARLLGSITPVGMLKRMIQFKEKSGKQGQDASLGLLDYPVLMAADILLYGADLVPVGDDQSQHLELTRDIAERFNRLYKSMDKPVFKLPEALLVKESARVMSLTDGGKKMSKSDPDDGSRINLLDSKDVIRRKIKRAKTDVGVGLEFGNPERRETDNLLALYMVLSGKSREEVVKECGQLRFGPFKELLSDTVVAFLSPIQERYDALIKNHDYLIEVLRKGRKQAQEVADETLARAQAAMGFTTIM